MHLFSKSFLVRTPAVAGAVAVMGERSGQSVKARLPGKGRYRAVGPPSNDGSMTSQNPFCSSFLPPLPK